MTDFFLVIVWFYSRHVSRETGRRQMSFQNRVQLSNLASANLSSRCRTISQRKEERKPPRAKGQLSPFDRRFNDTKSAVAASPSSPQRRLSNQQRFVNVASAPPTLLRRRGSRSSLFSATKICRQI